MSTPEITRSIAGGGAAGAAATILVWIGSLFGILVPDYVSAAIVVIITFAVGLLIPASKTATGRRRAGPDDTDDTVTHQ